MIGFNNIFNIRYSPLNKWIGQFGQTRGFCDFCAIELAVRACAYLLMRSYRKRGVKTYAEIITAFAPPCENNTNAYIKFVVPSNKFPFDCPETKSDYALLIQKMAKYETNYFLDLPFILKIIDFFKLTPYEEK